MYELEFAMEHLLEFTIFFLLDISLVYALTKTHKILNIQEKKKKREKKIQAFSSLI